MIQYHERAIVLTDPTGNHYSECLWNGYKRTKGGNKMRKYLYCENGFVEKPQWMPNVVGECRMP